MEGLIIKSTGHEYVVCQSDGTHALCTLKGNFRIKGIKSTSPIVVGDHVEFNEAGFITKLHERKNYIVRRPTNLSKQLQIIGANLDQTFLIMTLKEPVTPLQFTDRFLATAEAYKVPAILVFNKIDLLDDADLKKCRELETLYENIGYKVMMLNALSGEGVEALRTLMKGKISLLSGHSGVGKSTLVNHLFPRLNIKTGDVSDSHHKGMHTTTFSEMYPLEGGGYVIDTPGIKSFGLVDVEEAEISHYFPEIFEASKDCKFANCTHRHEPQCAVKEAIKAGKIALSRYESYLSILEDVGESRYR